jgi:hypothetical protein
MSEPSERDHHEAFYFFEKHGCHHSVGAERAVAVVPMEDSTMRSLAAVLAAVRAEGRAKVVKRIREWLDEPYGADLGSQMIKISGLRPLLYEIERGN